MLPSLGADYSEPSDHVRRRNEKIEVLQVKTFYDFVEICLGKDIFVGHTRRIEDYYS